MWDLQDEFVDAATIFQYLAVTVLDGETVVDGVLELRNDWALWRPAAPWIPGVTYTVVTKFDRAGVCAALFGIEWCYAAEQRDELVVDPQPLPATVLPPISVVEAYEVVPDRSLAALVCCGESLPRLENSGCGDYVIQDSACHPRRAVGRLELKYMLDTSGLSEAVVGNLAASLVVDGAAHSGLTVGIAAPECVRLEVMDLARGEVLVDERCFGEDLAEQLGGLELDPSDELAEICEGQPYVCEVVDRAWDESRCVTWPEGQPYVAPSDEAEPGDAEAQGCGCRGAEAPAVAPLLVLLARRRRR